MKKLYFVTVNTYKTTEVQQYFSVPDVKLEFVNYRIQEILNLDLDEIVKDKTLKAHKYLGLPCVVEHGGLLINALQSFPGGLSKVVWDTTNDLLCGFIPKGISRSATAKSVIGYCDGMRIHLFKGETTGTVAESSRGNYKFQWDPIFIPDGATETYAEMGFPKKGQYSQAAKAWSQLADHLKKSIS
ncbi:MAG: non-canonical purine NTP pyrophosphatase [Verrucomicrobiota bacterium]|jgi:XTP/dITP diphosphohydrolase